MTNAFLFPGQGSQVVGMGKDLAGGSAVARKTFEEADEVLGISLSRVCFEGPEADLQLTATAQPAILACSIAALRCLEQEGHAPDVVAGHSLGEYSALVAAGALAFADALRLVRKRGTFMQEAVAVGEGAMAAVMGLEPGVIEGICSEAEAECPGQVVSAANLNAPGQVVISGHAGAVDRAVALSQQKGARRAVRLAVSAPFHCSLMKPAADRLAAELATTEFRDPRVPVVANVDAQPLTRGEDAREALARQVTAPVQWELSVRRLASLGVRKAVEVGPGRVLSGLVKRIDREVSCTAAGDPEGIAAVKEFLS